VAGKVNLFWPCGVFYAAGEPAKGFGVLMMQLSLVLWPVAVRAAREFTEARGVQAMLTEFSQEYQAPEKLPQKRFWPKKPG
jgi:hypothetical protein